MCVCVYIYIYTHLVYYSFYVEYIYATYVLLSSIHIYLRVPWTSRRLNQSILKEINPEYSLEGLMLKLKLWPPDVKSQLTGNDLDAGKD